MPYFAPGTFAEPPAKLDEICALADARKAVEVVKLEVILSGAHRSVSDGMREWAIMGWYGMPAVAIMRAACCPGAAEAQLPVVVPTCEIEAAVRGLATAATSTTGDDAQASAALEAYTKAAKCVARAGTFTSFGMKGGIQEGELVTFEKTLKRARALAKKK